MLHGPLNVKLLKISFLSDDISLVTSLTDATGSDTKKNCFKMFQRIVFDGFKNVGIKSRMRKFRQFQKVPLC